MNKCSPLLLIFCVAAFPPRSFGATHTVVDPSELSAAIARAVPGDVIVLRNGQWPDTSIHLDRSGAEGKPITVKAQTAGQVVLTGASSLNFAGDWLVVEGLKFERLNGDRVFVDFADGADHCRLTDSAILESNNGRRNWIHMRRGINNRIDHCRFSGMDQPGMQIQVETERERPNHHRIDNNFFGHRARGNGNGFETIRIGYSHQQTNFAHTTVERNLFYRCNGENEIISNKSTGNRIIYNTFLDNSGELTLRHGDKAWVEGNWFLGNNVRGSGGVRVIGSDHVVANNYFSALQTYAILVRRGVETDDPKSYTQVKNALIAFNTIVDCPKSLVIGSGRGTLIPADSRIANNIVHYPAGTLIEYAAQPTNFVYEGNIMLGGSLGVESLDITLRDPKLVKAADGIHRPAADSPARNAAADGYKDITLDISGNSRTGTKDAGAQVLTAGAKIARPLTERDVGPLWMRN